MTTLPAFLLARLAEDDVLTEPHAWQVRIRPAVLRLFPRSVLLHMANKHRDHPEFDEGWAL